MVPKVGRFRLFRKDGLRYRCRLCRKLFKRDSMWRHFETEVFSWGGMDEGIITRLAYLVALRRSRRNLRNARAAKMEDPYWHTLTRKELLEKVGRGKA